MAGEMNGKHPLISAKREIEDLSDSQLDLALRQLKDGYEVSGVQDEGLVRNIFDEHLWESEFSFDHLASIFYYEGSKRFMRMRIKMKSKSKKG